MAYRVAIRVEFQPTPTREGRGDIGNDAQNLDGISFNPPRPVKAGETPNQLLMSSVNPGFQPTPTREGRGDTPPTS